VLNTACASHTQSPRYALTCRADYRSYERLGPEIALGSRACWLLRFVVSPNNCSRRASECRECSLDLLDD
jgi:hypothetical protein